MSTRTLRHLAAIAVVLTISSTLYAPLARAAWIVDGTPVCTAPGPQSNLNVVADGSGGAIAIWTDQRTAPGVPGLYAQRILADGSIAPGWTTDGVLLNGSGGAVVPLSVAPDGAGGVWVVWYGNGIYSQHVLADGTLEAGYPAGGRVLHAPLIEPPKLCADGAGGCYYTVQKTVTYHVDGGSFSYQEIHVYHLAQDGGLASGWPVDGAIVFGGTYSTTFQMKRDPAGGVDFGTTYTACNGYYCGYYNAVVGWIKPDGTIPYAGGTSTIASPGYITFVFAPDGTGGIVLGFLDGPAFTSYAQHLSPVGAALWPARFQFSSASYAFVKQIISLGPQGMVISFSDVQNSYFTRAQLWLNNGALAPGWSARGTLVRSANVEPQFIGVNGGVLFTWNEGHPGTLGSDIYALVLTSAGSIATGWMAEGSPVCAAAGDQFSATPVADGVGGSYIFWLDRRDGTANQHIYAQRIGGDGGRDASIAGSR